MIDEPKKNLDAAASVRRGKILKRRILSASVIVVIVILALLWYFRSTRKSDNLGSIETATVELGTITQVISATGSVTAQTGAQVNIGSQITGRIKRLYADVGSKVKAGQTIAELDLPDVRAQLSQARASLNVARLKLQQNASGVGLQRTNVNSDILKAQANVDTARAAYNQSLADARLQVSTAKAAVRQAQASAKNAHTFLDRNRQLLAKGYVAAQDVDNAETQAAVADAQLDSAGESLKLTQAKTATEIKTAQSAVDNAKAVFAAARAGTAQNVIKGQSVSEARAAVQQAQAQVEYWQAQWAKTVIKSPISGTVLSLAVQQGETIAAGLSAPTLIRVTDLDRLQVDAFVDETDIGSVRIGQPASVTVDAYPNRVFRGRVIKIASGATMQQNVVTYDTTIALDNREGLLKPDLTATVQITVGEKHDVIVAPIEAVKAQGKSQVVYVRKGDKVSVRPVTTGISDETRTEIVSGLREGDVIVLAGYEPGGAGGPGGMRMSPFGPMGGGARGGRGGR